ncbi:hypothetical protein GCM10022224_010730 [Nonomuraea antimicrobica]|uniref:Uncharacterized protein n=1 Tax=Nonomuraea antimicrobica TaxID=561173 RepID=A0ABP7B6Y5_9ACTN
MVKSCPGSAWKVVPNTFGALYFGNAVDVPDTADSRDTADTADVADVPDAVDAADVVAACAVAPELSITAAAAPAASRPGK